MARKPTDTSKMHPAAHLLAAMSEGPSESIEASEQRGQDQLVNSEVIPTDGSTLDKDRAALEELGFELGEPDKDDPLFREAKLPPGWKREGSDHAMWSYIADERGMRRIAIFYKAAFYDRGAHMHIEREPKTLAQVEALDAIYGSDVGQKAEWRIDSKMSGDVMIVRVREMEKGEDGRPLWDSEAGDWAWTGEVVERFFDIDGLEFAPFLLTPERVLAVLDGPSDEDRWTIVSIARKMGAEVLEVEAAVHALLEANLIGEEPAGYFYTDERDPAYQERHR